MKHNAVLPDETSKLSKKDQVAGMFNDIAGKYDFLNRFLSLGIDKGWRNKAIESLRDAAPKTILDVATGTADLALTAIKKFPDAKITGVDIADQMLAVGTQKIAAQNHAGSIVLMSGDSEALPFADNSFDAVTCAFGTRNFQNLEKGLAEMLRVLKPGGRLAVLEFSKPKQFPVKQVFGIYFKYVLPFFGKMVSKHNRAYTYLPESVSAFPEGKAFTDILDRTGYRAAAHRPLTFGICALYTAQK